MPRIGEIRGYQFFFYSNEGVLEDLPKVFVWNGIGEAEFLVSQDVPPVVLLRRSHGLESEDLAFIRTCVSEMAEELRDAWNKLFC